MAHYNRKLKQRSIWDYLATAVFIGLLVVGAAWLERQNATEISATARIVDGDSLEMRGQRVRLVGIDAPELDQICRNQVGNFSCGVQARDHLRLLVGDQMLVDCVGEGEDKYGRLLAECFVGDISLNAKMVVDGWAVAYGGFDWEERRARREKLGLWAGEFDDPSDWRIKSGGLVEARSGSALRGIWRWTISRMKALGEYSL